MIILIVIAISLGLGGDLPALLSGTINEYSVSHVYIYIYIYMFIVCIRSIMLLDIIVYHIMLQYVILSGPRRRPSSATGPPTCGLRPRALHR